MLLFFVAAFTNGAIREALWRRTSPRRQANKNGKSRPLSNSEVASEVIDEEPEQPLRFKPTPSEDADEEPLSSIEEAS